MEVKQISSELYLFTTYEAAIDLSFNQYLLMGQEPLLIHTGSKPHAVALAPHLKQVLGGRNLEHVFISHFESDECGGLCFLQEHYPELHPICSPVTARQLTGFGFDTQMHPVNPGDNFTTDTYTLQFVAYPAEMHLWPGLLAFEQKRGILFSSDLFIRRGELQATSLEIDWPEEVKGMAHHQVPDPAAREKLQQTLLSLPIKMVAPGHGPCLLVK